MTARAEILAAIAKAAAPSSPPPARAYQQTDQLSRAEIVARFISRITDYGVTLRQVAPHQIAEAAAAICIQRGITSLVTAPDCPPEWLPAAIPAKPDENLAIPELAAFGASLTSAALAIAETGTLVLDAGPAQGRRALSLLPDLHICVLFDHQIVECVPAALTRLAPSAQAGRPFTFISGPSATADIEFDRVQGVHGPRQLDVILVSA